MKTKWYAGLKNLRIIFISLCVEKKNDEQTAWQSNNGGPGEGRKRKRRTRVPDKPDYPLNLWSIMKNCIGKDLSKIPMPVNFSEPLSMLQRLTEDYEYAEILDKLVSIALVYFRYLFLESII